MPGMNLLVRHTSRVPLLKPPSCSIYVWSVHIGSMVTTLLPWTYQTPREQTQDYRSASLMRRPDRLFQGLTVLLLKANLLQDDHNTRVIVGIRIYESKTAHHNLAPWLKDDTLQFERFPDTGRSAMVHDCLNGIQELAH